VWQAVRVGTGQDVALKIFTSPGRLDWRYLQREVDRLLRVAEHPHIITLLDANFQHTPPFFAMALLRRGSLAEQCSCDFDDVDRAATWFEQMASALEFAHGKGLMHCDLKPGNVLLDEEGHVRLADFGQSHLRGEAAFALGTLAYMAPEQAIVADVDGAPAVPTAGWDIYGIGATMYALLGGQPPHGNSKLPDTLTQIETAHERLSEYRRHVNETAIVPLRRLNPRVDVDLANIIEHCLDPHPRNRYRHVSEVAGDLQRRRQHRPLRCKPPSTHYVLRKYVRRNLGMVVIAIAAVVALATVVEQMRITHQDERVHLKSVAKELETQRDKLASQVEVLLQQDDVTDPTGRIAELEERVARLTQQLSELGIQPKP
jgi:hypothetical protein